MALINGQLAHQIALTLAMSLKTQFSLHLILLSLYALKLLALALPILQINNFVKMLKLVQPGINKLQFGQLMFYLNCLVRIIALVTQHPTLLIKCLNVKVKHVSLLIRKLQGNGVWVKPLAKHTHHHLVGVLSQLQPLAQTSAPHTVLLNGHNAMELLAQILHFLDLIALTTILVVPLIYISNYGRALSQQHVWSNVKTLFQPVGFLVKLLPVLVLQVLEDSVILTQLAKHFCHLLDHGGRIHKAQLLAIITATQLI
mgnify:CR=1 FL=1